jgi:hypothetical protein
LSDPQDSTPRNARQDSAASDKANAWRDLQEKFDLLANEDQDQSLSARWTRWPPMTAVESDLLERGLLCWLYAFEHEHRGWRLMAWAWSPLNSDDGRPENVRERYAALAMRAVTMLGLPPRATPLEFWLHSLYLHVQGPGLASPFMLSDPCGILEIKNVCKVSATFCSWLEQKALETPISALRPATEQTLEPAVQTTKAASEKIQRGKRCVQIITEVRRLRNLVVGTGRTMAEVKDEHPTLLVWAFRDTLPQQDREIFDHPNQWGPVVGYALGLLSKEYGKSPATIRDWVKAFRHHERQRSTPSS